MWVNYRKLCEIVSDNNEGCTLFYTTYIYIYLLSLYTVFDNNKHVVACCSIKAENLTNTSDK